MMKIKDYYLFSLLLAFYRRSLVLSYYFSCFVPLDPFLSFSPIATFIFPPILSLWSQFVSNIPEERNIIIPSSPVATLLPFLSYPADWGNPALGRITSGDSKNAARIKKCSIKVNKSMISRVLAPY
mgnify:CR=1 FL=1